MEIYIEYAFLENFFFDAVLLRLALYVGKRKPAWGKIVLSAVFGGIFALLFPFLNLSVFWGGVLKIAVGLTLCMPIAGALRTKKDWGRYTAIAAAFFALSFGFGGALMGVYGGFSLSADRAFLLKETPHIIVFLGFAALSLLAVWLVKKAYVRRAVASHLFTCILIGKERRISAEGFLDSGNLAQKNGIPVCFLSPELIYELFGQDILFGEGKEWGQVCDEMKISTVTGERILPLYQGEIEVKRGKETVRKRVYFALSSNMISREYKILLNARMFEGS